MADTEKYNINVIPGKGNGILYANLKERIKDLQGKKDTTDYKIREVGK